MLTINKWTYNKRRSGTAWQCLRMPLVLEPRKIQSVAGLLPITIMTWKECNLSPEQLILPKSLNKLYENTTFNWKYPFIKSNKSSFSKPFKWQRHYRFKHLSRQWLLYSENQWRQTTINPLENRKLSAQKVEYGGRKCWSMFKNTQQDVSLTLRFQNINELTFMAKIGLVSWRQKSNSL